MKTRATKGVAPAKPTEAEETSDTSKSLAPNCLSPPLLFILPDNPSPHARIVTLPSPATSSPARYYFCPEQGIYEFTKIAAPKKSPRSWLLAPPRTEKDVNGPEENPDHGEKDEEDSAVKPASNVTDVSTGYVIQDADLFLATSLDPLFVLLPALLPKPDETKQLFLTIDDHLDTLAENSKHLKHLIRSDELRRTFDQRANAVCDNVDMGDEKMYRLSIDKLLPELLKKAEKMSASGLPASMEEHFVQDALKVPVMIVQREESFSEAQADAGESLESQASATTTTHSLDTQNSSLSVLTEATSTSISAETPAPYVPIEIVKLLRLRTALQFIMSSYIPPALRTTLLTALSSSNSPVDFKPLDAHLDKIASLKKEQHALRSLSDNISRKRSAANDEEADLAREEKKRKKDEEDAKKKNTSRGVKQLAKVDTSGMKKLSSFFTKAPAKKKA